MSKKSVVEQSIEALEKIAEKLDTLNGILEVLTVEVISLNDELIPFIQQVKEKGIKWLSK